MRIDSILFAIGGMLFGLIVGWIIGSQQMARPVTQPQVAQAAAPASGGQGQQQQTPVLDEGRVQALQTIVNNDPKNAEARVQLGNVYFDGERYQDAIKWYEE